MQVPPQKHGGSAYLFWTMLMAIQSPGYTFFPMRSLNMMNVSIKKSCKSAEHTCHPTLQGQTAPVSIRVAA